MSFITTYTGKHIDPTDPDMSKVDIRDIAHALSLLCRGNGHVQTFFSVGQHCLWCAKEAQARGYDRRVVLACLLHDASEAYMADVPRPVKQLLPAYVAAEDALLEKIYGKYLGAPLTKEEQALVKAIDDDVLYFDLKELLQLEPAMAEPAMKVAPDHGVRPFAEVEQEYLDLFAQLQ